MFRPATRQLAHSFARQSLNATTRSTYRTGTFARIAPVAGVSPSRYYSSKSPQKPPQKSGNNNGGRREKEDGKDVGKEQGSSEAAAERPLRPGWVRLTKEEIFQLELIWKMGPQSAKFDSVLERIKQSGAPLELRSLLEKQRTAGFGMLDAVRVMKMVKTLAEGLAAERHAIKQEAENTDFNSHKPGQQDNKPSSKGEEQGEQNQQEQNQQQQSQEGQGQEQRSGQSQGQKGNKNDEPQPPRLDMSDIAVGAGSVILFYTFYSMFTGGGSREITWQELRKNFLDKGLVEKMTVEGDRVRVDLNREAAQALYPDTVAARPGFHYYFSIGSVDAFERRLESAQEELGIPPIERIPVSYAGPSAFSSLVFAFGPTLLLVGLLVFVSRKAGGMGGGGGGGMFGFSKSKAKMFNHDSAVKVKFADVAGMDEAKVEIMEFVSFLKSPERFQRLGAKIPRGAILSGPPGTGKTLLAKATAGESQVPFFSVSGSEFVEMFVGVGASRVRDLFAVARKNAPCIIFIDEIDAVGKSRSDGGMRGGGNDEREATLNQILTEMDGFNTSEQVVVLAGTNRPDILDQALMRPGRFDRHIHVDRPTMKGRQDIFKVHLKQILTKEDIEYLTGRLAALTPGFAGADIANAVNEAALIGM